MALITETLGLTVPELSDKIGESIPAIGENFEKIDTAIKEQAAENKEAVQAVEDSTDEKIDELTTVINAKSEIVFGTYTGNGNADRFISLGFTPVAVEVYAGDGGQYDSSGSSRYYFGGLALKSYPCRYDGTNGNFYIIKIDGNGFYVTCAESSNGAEDINSNINGEVYYFKAYKNGEIIKIS